MCIRDRVRLVAGQTTKVSCRVELRDGFRELHGTIRTMSGLPVPATSTRIFFEERPDDSWWILFSRHRWACLHGSDGWAALRDTCETEVVEFHLTHIPAGELGVLVEGAAFLYELTEQPDGDLTLDIVLLEDEGESPR